MKIYLLDGAGAGLIFGFLIIFMIVAIVLEAIALLLLKYNGAGKSFLDAFLVNIASLAVGFLIVNFVPTGLDFTNNIYLDFFLIFLITVVAEFVVLHLLNRAKPMKKTLVAAVMINLVSYLLLIFFRFYFTG